MKLSKTLLTIAAVVLTAGFVQAVPITGMLNIAGTATFDTKSLMTATRVNSFSNVTVQGGNSGDFAAIAIGTPVVMTALYIFAPSTSTNGLWSVAGFTFELLASSVQLPRDSHFLTVLGTGMMMGNGFDATPGVWAFTSQNAGGRPHSTFSFSANTAAVPDSGSAVALLGLALTGIEVLRRTLRNCPA
jgi:hypothetical protein